MITVTTTIRLIDITDMSRADLEAMLDAAADTAIDERIVADVTDEGTTTIDRLEDLFAELDDDFFGRIDRLVAEGRIARRGRRILAA